MEEKNREKLEEAGWTFGRAADFLGLTEEERSAVGGRLNKANPPRFPLYELTEEEWEVLKNAGGWIGNDIVAAGPWIKGRGEMPHRVVLRHWGVYLVIHNHVISCETRHAYFDQGYYYQLPAGPDEAKHVFEMAWSKFEERIRRDPALGLKPVNPVNPRWFGE